MSASQSSTYKRNEAIGALDKNYTTMSHTLCGYNEDHWFNMQFGAVRCFSKIRISNPFIHFYHAFRMEDAQVFVVNTGKSIESLCGILKIRKEWTIEGQTYR